MYHRTAISPGSAQRSHTGRRLSAPTGASWGSPRGARASGHQVANLYTLGGGPLLLPGTSSSPSPSTIIGGFNSAGSPSQKELCKAMTGVYVLIKAQTESKDQLKKDLHVSQDLCVAKVGRCRLTPGC
jgi:hypothetical protein